ncbi:MAG: hypothetical protein AAFV62_07005 [Pseudomonadota bacterium]
MIWLLRAKGHGLPAPLWEVLKERLAIGAVALSGRRQPVTLTPPLSASARTGSAAQAEVTRTEAELAALPISAGDTLLCPSPEFGAVAACRVAAGREARVAVLLSELDWAALGTEAVPPTAPHQPVGAGDRLIYVLHHAHRLVPADAATARWIEGQDVLRERLVRYYPLVDADRLAAHPLATEPDMPPRSVLIATASTERSSDRGERSFRHRWEAEGYRVDMVRLSGVDDSAVQAARAWFQAPRVCDLVLVPDEVADTPRLTLRNATIAEAIARGALPIGERPGPIYPGVPLETAALTARVEGVSPSDFQQLRHALGRGHLTHDPEGGVYVINRDPPPSRTSRPSPTSEAHNAVERPQTAESQATNSRAQTPTRWFALQRF